MVCSNLKFVTCHAIIIIAVLSPWYFVKIRPFDFKTPSLNELIVSFLKLTFWTNGTKFMVLIGHFQKTSANVTFVLSGLLAGSAPNLVHKCDLLIRLERDVTPVLECSKWLTTYYGAFEFPCELKGTKNNSVLYTGRNLSFALIIMFATHCSGSTNS